MAWTRNLGCQDDGIAVLALHPAADNILRAANPFDIGRHGITLCRVEKVDTRVQTFVENAVRLGLIGLRPKGHGAHADIGHINGAFADATMFHIVFLLILSGRANDQKGNRG